ncbi:MAG: ABC transporter ATP-binding protein [Thermodesulfovibrionales bacterium]|nr:ABC transporter ATP-binding protein [Thermodesulfovibrionales bacterium]
MKRLFELVAPHWRRIALAGACSLIVSGANGSIAWLVKPAVDKIFIAGDRGFLAMLSVAVFVIFILRGGFTYLQNYLMRSSGVKIARDIRNNLYRHFLYLPMSHYSKSSTGAMMSRALNDAAVIQELLAYTVRDFFVQTGTIVVLITVAFYVRWDLTLIALVVLPGAFYFASRLGKRLKKVSMRAQQKISGITESLSEGLSGVKVIKAFSMEEPEALRFKEKNQDYYRELMRSTRIFEASALIMEFTGGIGIAFVLWYGSSLIFDKTITAGGFFSFITAVLMIYTPAKRLTQVNNALQQASAAMDRIDALSKEPVEADGNIQLKEINEITFRNVSFKYEGKEEDALNGINLNIKKGEVAALVGRSGSGKTTLVDLVAGFYAPTSGSILINGIDINSVSKKSLRSQIGIVSQDVILFNDTLKANIAYGRPDAPEGEALRAAKAAYAHDFIERLPEGYNTGIGQRGVRLSGGERQRISIARAVFKNPPVLILDEATSALDTQSEMIVQKALDNLMTGSGAGLDAARTVFVIAHRISTIKRADRIVVLDKGRIVEEGSHDELIKLNGHYKMLYTLQFGGEVTTGTGGEA